MPVTVNEPGLVPQLPHVPLPGVAIDAEARVLAHMPGQGKHAGKMGALWVETPEGVRFKLGTGFTDAERRDPPAIGSWVTYRFRGTHAGSGAPRFASYLRAAPG